MDVRFNPTMSPREFAKARMQAEAFNSKLKAEQQAMGLKPGSMDGQDRYLKLLLKQLQNQDPTNPMKNQEFAAQMAQFSSLQQMTKLNMTTGKMLDNSQNSGMYGMLGKQIVWKPVGDGPLMRGVADSIGFSNGKAHLNVGNRMVQKKEIIRVSMPETGK